jgi:hypothetical protein
MEGDKVIENNLEKSEKSEKYNEEVLNYYEKTNIKDTNSSINTNILYFETDIYNVNMVFTKKKQNIQII